jgi:RNA polymerase sigma factor (sigma-70 family)
MNDVIGHLRQVALRCDGGPTDSQLLECFVSRRDEAAFAALVRRHGPMVLGVCRRVLRHEQDAEDAFQATFLVLARKAAGLRARQLVAHWLYGVAYRTALRARTMNARRQAHEQQARDRARPDAAPDDGWQELLPLLDRELNGLPERYRVAVLLCDLQGMTRRDAARQLNLPEGTLSGRLTTARKLLARRLARHGPALTGAALAAALSETAASAGVTGVLADATARAAVLGAGGEAVTAGAVPARVVALTEGVVRTMLLSKLKTIVAVGLAVCLTAGAVGLTYRTGAAEPGRVSSADRARADDVEALRLEVEALRKSLHATRERVQTLEDEVRALKAAPRPQGGGGGGGGMGGGFGQFGGGGGFSPGAGLAGGGGIGGFGGLQPGGGMGGGRQAATRPRRDDPLADAEAALKKLRQDPTDQKAAEALDKALQRLREREKQKEGVPNRN